MSQPFHIQGLDGGSIMANGVRWQTVSVHHFP